MLRATRRTDRCVRHNCPRAPDPLPAGLRKTKLVLHVDSDIAELLDWGAKQMGSVTLVDYALDLLLEAANEIQDRGRAVGRRR